MSREYIAKTLKVLREKTGLTAEEVGKIVGKSGKTVNAWENNRGQPDAETLMVLCDVYSVDNILDEFNPLKNIKNSSDLFDKSEEQLVGIYRQLNEEGQKKLLGNADDLLATGKYKKMDEDEYTKKGVA